MSDFKKNVRILGIDPGSSVTGWGIVDDKSGVLQLVDCGAAKPPKADFNTRLAHIFHTITEVCEKYSPDELAIEQVFVSKNAASALKLGQARGIVLAVCLRYGIPIFDYEPTKVKQAIVGTGRADKEQVAFMVQTLLNVKKIDKPLDTTDALAVAVCAVSNASYFVGSDSLLYDLWCCV